jgi:flagella basal body P-ring formation protein FlgA
MVEGAMTVHRFNREKFFILFLLVVGMSVVARAPSHASLHEAPVTIKLVDHIELDSVEIRLGQMAEIDGADHGLKEKLATVLIGRAPQAGRSRPISRDYVMLRLRQSGHDPTRFNIEAPEKMTVTRRAATISKADLEMLVRDYITANPPYSGAEMTISAVRVSGDVKLPTGNIQHTIEYMHQTRPTGTIPINIFFSVDGAPVTRVMATAHITLLKEVPVTRHPIARYQMIQADDLVMQTMDVTDLPDNAYLSLQDIEGQRARRSIGSRSVLRRDQLEFPPAVNKGDRVMIVAESGGLRITTMGEVRSIGRPGERIKVINLDSNKMLFARVIDSRTVQVDF